MPVALCRNKRLHTVQDNDGERGARRCNKALGDIPAVVLDALKRKPGTVLKVRCSSCKWVGYSYTEDGRLKFHGLVDAPDFNDVLVVQEEEVAQPVR